MVLAIAASSSIQNAPGSSSSQRKTSPTPVRRTRTIRRSNRASCSASGRNFTTLNAENTNSSPATTVTGRMPQNRTIAGASSALPVTSPADEASDRNELAEASSAWLATIGAAADSAGCDTWCSTRTRKMTASIATKPVPVPMGTRSASPPIAT